MRVYGKRTGIAISLGSCDHIRLAEIAADRNNPQKHVWRADRVAVRTGRRHDRDHARHGQSQDLGKALATTLHRRGHRPVAGRKTRPSQIPLLDDAVVERVVALTLIEPPGDVTHRIAAAVGAACTISISSVHHIWCSHGLRPQQIRPSKLSDDPQFAAKVRDIVGLYVDPPEHAAVLSMGEKSQI